MNWAEPGLLSPWHAVVNKQVLLSQHNQGWLPLLLAVPGHLEQKAESHQAPARDERNWEGEAGSSRQKAPRTSVFWFRPVPRWKDPLEEETAACSSILARRIPGTEEPGGPSPRNRKQLDMMHVCKIKVRVNRLLLQIPDP